MTQEQTTELNKIAKAMVAPGKGILAADESMRASSGTVRYITTNHKVNN